MLQSIDKYIKKEYGSKTGLLQLFYSRLMGLSGQWSKYRNIDWSKIESLVFICMGNICRSPLGEEVARSYNIATRSYGLTAPIGDPADPRAIEIAKKYGMDLTKHRTTPCIDANFEENDLIIAMEPQHFTHYNFPKNTKAQKTLLGLWNANYRPYLHDPYNTNEIYFEKCERLVIEGTKNIINQINIKKSL